MPKNYSEIYTSVYTDGNSMSFGNAMLRGNGVPLDITEVYNSYEAAVNYAANNPVAYEGQLIAVTENGDTTVYVITPKSQGKYEIDPDMDGLKQEVDVYIKEVGSAPKADNKTIELVNGALKLVGLTELDDTKTYQPILVNGKLEWRVPSETTVEGLDTRLTEAEASIEAIETAVGDADSGLTKEVAEVKTAAQQNTADISALGDELRSADTTLHTTIQGEIETAVSAALAEAKEYADDNDTDVRGLISAAQKTADDTAADLASEIENRVKADAELETSLKSYVGQEIGKQAHFSAKVVASTEEMNDTATLYLMKTVETGDDLYEEWMIIEDTPVKIGTTATDLSDYVTKDRLATDLNNQKLDLEAEISALSDAHNKDKNELVDSISEVAGDLGTFKTSVASTYETKEDAESKNGELTAALQALAAEVEKKADASVSADIANAQDAAARAQGTADSNAEAIEALQAADGSLDERIGELEAVEAEKNVVASVSEEFTLDPATRALSVNKISIDKVDGLNATLLSQQDQIDGKVSKLSTEYNGAQVEWTLLSPENQAKLAALTVGDNGNIQLSGKVTAENVDGLASFLTQNRDSISGLLSTTDKEKLDSVENGAQENVFEGLRINGTLLSIAADKTVNIPFATNDTYGVVLSALGENKISVKDDGTMEVNSLNVNRLLQTEGDTLILNGGTSSV